MAVVINPARSNEVGIADDGYVLDFRLSDAGEAKSVNQYRSAVC